MPTHCRLIFFLVLSLRLIAHGRRRLLCPSTTMPSGADWSGWCAGSTAGRCLIAIRQGTRLSDRRPTGSSRCCETRPDGEPLVLAAQGFVPRARHPRSARRIASARDLRQSGHDLSGPDEPALQAPDDPTARLPKHQGQAPVFRVRRLARYVGFLFSGATRSTVGK